MNRPRLPRFEELFITAMLVLGAAYVVGHLIVRAVS